MGDACTRRGHFAVGFLPAGGLTRRLRRGSKACRPMGRSFSSGGPKGAVNGKPTARLRAHNHAEGLTRRLRRGRWGCRPEGGSTFFRSERKYQRKHAARRLREKGFYCPFCRRGSQRRAQFSWTDNSYAYARSCARLFPPSKWAGLFPFAAYRRSAPPPLGWEAELKRRGLEYFIDTWLLL